MTLSLIITLLLISGCGFQLRGALDIPSEYSPVFIQSGGPVGTAMEERLQGGGLSMTQVAAQAGLIVRVLGQQRSSRVVAVDSSGKALAYEQVYTVTFDALGAQGQVLLPPQSMSAARTFDDNPDVAVLGKQLESEIIYQDLVSDVAERVLLRVRAALTPKAP
ncbi:LPS-assembly lipoprotein LptE [Thiorhodovibrio frisius]|uniref:LPS-assembly lipoprotein LptE n=1 Tax=Thiorhodovibrio frisius TaxID=631362 RepID=UPI000255E1CC|nr:LPS assembly lipoprotein LptE [Thiorhodovibrio frisius]